MEKERNTEREFTKEQIEERQEKVNYIKEQIDKDIKTSINILNASPLNKVRKVLKENLRLFNKGLRVNSSKVLFIILASFPILMWALFIVNVNTTGNKLSAYEKVDKTSSLVNISMNEDTFQLDIAVNTLSIDTYDNSLQFDNTSWISKDMGLEVDTYKIDNTEFKVNKELTLNSFKISNEEAYVQYTNNNNTASKELLLSSKEIAERDNIALLENYICKKCYGNSYIILREAISGGKILKKNLEDVVEDIKATTKYSDNDSEIILRFEELGDLNVTELQETIGTPEVNYLNQEGVVRVSVNNIDYLYISGINNDIIKCYDEDLLATTNENIFIHKNYIESDEIGFKTFAIKTDNNIFVFMTNTKYEKDLMQNVLEQLNIDYSNIKLREIQEVVPK